MPQAPVPGSCGDCRLAGYKGNTLLTAKQHGPARDTLQKVLDHLPEESAKQRSVFLGDLAAVAVAENNAEEACALAIEALDHLARYWYATGMDRIRAVRESLTKWELLPCVRSSMSGYTTGARQSAL
jgi:hypothetical protein